ncbi:ROK family protein [Phycicoccus sp. M110.8]|uniref:ROK family protein n=1 Tax=Phycicoccus sp. M110.8 TaxID=3075433 RepID=UPI0028FD23AA|nr:ROK family protein [Phycicoccus sp. M110.8]MDU0313141.1 ROK family protein [Phycicoccus sp. M110.8]
MTDRTVAALDIGGTKTAAALVDGSGAVVARATAPTPGRAGPAAILQTAADLVKSLAARSAATTPAALGVGSAGVVDSASGRVTGSTDVLRDWMGTDLRGELSRRTGLPTAVVNDVHAHALGEARFGVGAGQPSLLFLAVGTGVGASFVFRGEVLTGAHGVAGHAGHLPSVYAADRACTCGGRGHLEAVAAGPALAAEYGRRAGATDVVLHQVAALAERGDEVALGVAELGGRAVGAALGGMANLLDPHSVVVGGGVTGLGRAWWQALRAAFTAEVLPVLRGTTVRPTSLGGDGALLGAASIAPVEAP